MALTRISAVAKTQLYVHGLRPGWNLRAGGAGAAKDSWETHSVPTLPSEDYASACSFGRSPCHSGQGQSY